MKKLLTITLGVAALAVSAFGAGITVTAPISAGGKELKPGAYKFEMQGDKVVFKEGRTVVAEAAATQESAAQKYRDTTYESRDGKITAIRVGGSTTRIVLK